MLTLYDFNKLDLNHRCEATWQHGECIGERDEGEHRILLYDLRFFSVAIWYHEAKNEITKAQSFRSVRLLEEFVDSLDISELKMKELDKKCPQCGEEGNVLSRTVDGNGDELVVKFHCSCGNDYIEDLREVSPIEKLSKKERQSLIKTITKLVRHKG